MMKNLQIVILFLLTLALTSGLHAQYENVWAFGTTSPPLQFAPGLDFNNNNNNPQLIATKIGGGGLGRASVCNSDGELLFYTNGYVVWDQNDNIMPNGNAIIPIQPGRGQSTPTSAALIVPMQDSAGKYYIFSINARQDAPKDYGKFFYSVLDMSLNNGLGDIEPNRRGILIDSNLGTHLTAVVGDRCNIWVLVCSLNHDIKAYEITSSGINFNPVISPNIGPGMIPYALSPHLPGVIKASPDRSKIAISMLGIPGLGNYGNSPSAATLYDFDASSGVVSNPLPLLEFGRVSGVSGMCDAYGICFSPDNSKLYVNYGVDYPWPAMDIVQFDLSSEDPADILASKFVLGYNGWFSDIKQGPDDKLYFLYTDPVITGTDMGSISEPNLPGTACQFSSYAFPLRMPGVYNGNWAYSLPNVVPILNRDTIYHSETIEGICSDKESLINATDTTGWDYIWSDGHLGAERHIDTSGGKYWVSYFTAPCVFHTDTFIVEPWDPFTVDLGRDTALCTDQFIVLNAYEEDASYLWQDGSTDSIYTIRKSGEYWVQVSKEGCTVSDTIQVSLLNVVQNLGQDTTLCKEQPIQIYLKGNIPEGETVLWNTGSTASSIIATDTGLYWITVGEPPCMGSDSIRIRVDSFCECVLNIPNAFTPNNDGLNDIFRPFLDGGCPVETYVLNIYNRFGKRVYSGINAEQGWNGTYSNGLPAEAGTYFYELQFIGGTKKKPYYQKGDVILIR